MPAHPASLARLAEIAGNSELLSKPFSLSRDERERVAQLPTADRDRVLLDLIRTHAFCTDQTVEAYLPRPGSFEWQRWFERRSDAFLALAQAAYVLSTPSKGSPS